MQSLKMCIVVLLFTCSNTIMYAFQQTPYLERLVTVNANNQKITEVFKAISKQTDVVFSYTGFNDEKRITKNYHKVPLKKVLDDLLKELSGTYVLKGKYIIIHFDLKDDAVALAGYVFNAIDSSRMENVDIYMKQNQYMTVSDQVGFFSVQYTGNLSQVSLLFRKEGYKDTNLVISNVNKRELYVYLKPTIEKQKTPGFHDSTGISVLKRKETDSLLIGKRNEHLLPDLTMQSQNQVKTENHKKNKKQKEPEKKVKSENVEEVASSPKLHHQVKLGLHAAIAIPTEGNLKQSNTKFGLAGDYFINNNLALGLNLSQNAFSLNNEPNYEYFNCSVIEFSVSGKYYFGKEKWRPHIGASVGLYTNKVNYSYTYFTLPYPYAYYTKQTTVTKSETENKFGFAPEAGFLYDLTKQIDFDATVKYHVIMSGYGTIPYWGVTVGFLYNF